MNYQDKPAAARDFDYMKRKPMKYDDKMKAAMERLGDWKRPVSMSSKAGYNRLEEK